jgi:hypothetical protein
MANGQANASPQGAVFRVTAILNIQRGGRVTCSHVITLQRNRDETVSSSRGPLLQMNASMTKAFLRWLAKSPAGF